MTGWTDTHILGNHMQEGGASTALGERRERGGAGSGSSNNGGVFTALSLAPPDLHYWSRTSKQVDSWIDPMHTDVIGVGVFKQIEKIVFQ